MSKQTRKRLVVWTLVGLGLFVAVAQPTFNGVSLLAELIIGVTLVVVLVRGRPARLGRACSTCGRRHPIDLDERDWRRQGGPE